jgi:PPOX class probable F420-dependent enzyme
VELDLENPKHARAAERLASETEIWLTSVNGDGQPQTSPMWFWWDGEAVYLVSEPDATKVSNITANPLVSLSLQATERANDEVVIIEGVATLEPLDSVPDWYLRYVDKYGTLIEEYGWTSESMLSDFATSAAIRVMPTRFRLW